MTTPSRLGRRTKYVAAAIALVGLIGSSVAGLAVSASNRESIDRWLHERGQVILASVEQTVKTAIDGLNATAAFLENSTMVTPEEFTGFTLSLDPSVRLFAVGYAAIVPGSEFESYVAERAALNPGYYMSEFDDAGAMVPAQLGRESYYPVELIFTGAFLIQATEESDTEIATLGLGFDAGSQLEWRISLEKAVASNGVSVSPFVELGAGDSVLGKAFIVSVPVHDSNGEVVGLVAAPMVDSLLASVGDPVLARGIDWHVSSSDMPSEPHTGPTWTQVIELPGTSWNLSVHPTPEILRELSGFSPWAASGLGLLLTALAVYLFVALAQRSGERRTVEEMERLAAEKDRFLASVAHEIRTPLTVVAGFAHELKARPGTFDSSEAADLLDLVAAQSDEVASIVEDLLVASRADLGLVTVRPMAVDLGAEVIRVVEASEAQIGVVPGTAWAWADPKRVRQVLRNLVTNAERYGGAIKQVRIGSEGDKAWVEVMDSGPPIPVEERGRIFEAYVSSSDRHAAGVGAMGLGLFISQRLSELLGGELTYNHDDEFSVFRFTLPATAATEAESAA